MKTTIEYKKINGEDFILMATYQNVEQAKKAYDYYKTKYGRARRVNNKIYCCQ